MIDKIQKYFLENSPLIWNTRLVPVGLIILVVNLLFFGIGYIATDTMFQNNRHYDVFGDLGIVYFASIVIAIIIFVTWLILYSRNNALKVYYPRKTIHVYMEWFLCFLICIGLAFIPCSLTHGSLQKWKDNTSLKEASEALRIIYKAQILIPSDVYSYTFDTEGDDIAITIPDDIKKNINLDSVDLSRYSFDYNYNKDNVSINGYIGPSLLFFKKSFYYYYYMEELDPQLSERNLQKDIDEVKSWLLTRNTTKIKALMADYMNLIKKHDLKSTVNVDNWFNRIYNPPFYPVDTTSVIASSFGSSGIQIGDQYYYINNSHKRSMYIPEIDNRTLINGYENILSNYHYTNDLLMFTLVCLTIALIISFLVFSYRITGGKKWLKTLLFVAIFALCLSLLTAIMTVLSYSYEGEQLAGMFFAASWVLLFLICLGYILAKIIGKKEKLTSNVAMTTFLWFIPCIIPIIYALNIIFLKYMNRYNFEDFLPVETMFWINIPICIIVMYPISTLIRKWKSLAEE